MRYRPLAFGLDLFAGLVLGVAPVPLVGSLVLCFAVSFLFGSLVLIWEIPQFYEKTTLP